MCPTRTRNEGGGSWVNTETDPPVFSYRLLTWCSCPVVLRCPPVIVWCMLYCVLQFDRARFFPFRLFSLPLSYQSKAKRSAARRGLSGDISPFDPQKSRVASFLRRNLLVPMTYPLPGEKKRRQEHKKHLGVRYRRRRNFAPQPHTTRTQHECAPQLPPNPWL